MARNGAEYVLVWKDEAGSSGLCPDKAGIDNVSSGQRALYSAGLAILLKEVGYTFNDVKQEILIAGGLWELYRCGEGNNHRPRSTLPIDKFKFLGATSAPDGRVSFACLSGHCKERGRGDCKEDDIS